MYWGILIYALVISNDITNHNSIIYIWLVGLFVMLIEAWTSDTRKYLSNSVKNYDQGKRIEKTRAGKTSHPTSC